MKLKEPTNKRLWIVIALLVLLFFGIGLLTGYYIGLNIAEGYYLPKLDNCGVLPLNWGGLLKCNMFIGGNFRELYLDVESVTSLDFIYSSLEFAVNVGRK